MFWQAGDLGLLINFGRNKAGAVLQHKVKGDWQDFEIDDPVVTNPFDPKELPPGEYRLWVLT